MNYLKFNKDEYLDTNRRLDSSIKIIVPFACYCAGWKFGLFKKINLQLTMKVWKSNYVNSLVSANVCWKLISLDIFKLNYEIPPQWSRLCWHVLVQLLSSINKYNTFDNTTVKCVKLYQPLKSELFKFILIQVKSYGIICTKIKTHTIFCVQIYNIVELTNRFGR